MFASRWRSYGLQVYQVGLFTYCMYHGLNREYVCAVCYVSPTRYDCNINKLSILAQSECNPIKSD